MDKALATLRQGDCTATILNGQMPGEFSIVYRDAGDNVLAQDKLTGVSTYHQREEEILTRLKNLCEGRGEDAPDLADSGEY